MPWNVFWEHPSRKYEKSVDVPMANGDEVSKQIGAVGHFRCSALTGEGIKVRIHLFE